MSEIKNGILGGVNGKVGPVVEVPWRGKNVIRTFPRRSNKTATEKQVRCRS